MNLLRTITINQQIIALILSKRDDPPSLWPKGPELTYYERLVIDTDKARLALKAGGLAPIIDEPG